MVSKMNDYIKLGSLFLILMTVGILYKRYEDKLSSDMSARNDAAIREYLITDSDDLTGIVQTKPILWIPIHYEYNSRKWDSFGSRSSYDLNQPYMYLTVKSIIHHCKESFHICLVDDKSFVRLMPDWKYADARLSNPVADHVRRLGVTKLLHIYGGMTVPPSFLCLRDLIEMYTNGTSNSKSMFIAENRNRSVTFSTREYIADPNIMGAPAGNSEMGALAMYMEKLTESNKTSSADFTGEVSEWCAANQRIIKVDASLIGVRDKNGRSIMIEDLLSNNYLDLTTHAYGVYIPSEDVLSRSKYAWFARLSGRQVLESNTIVGKYLLIANIPDANVSGSVPTSDGEKPEWIAYWQVPSNAPVWGVKPNYLGDRVTASFTAPSSVSN